MATHWDDLQYFLAVVEGGSLGAAARTLHVNHSTVLRHIASLEKSLDARLFDRLPGGYALTAQGQALAAGLAGMRDQVDAATRALTGIDLAPAGIVRLTAPDTLLHALLMPHLAAFRTAHPAIVLELVVDNAYLSLARREADVAVRGANRPPELLVGRRVGTVRSALYASKRYLRSLGRSRDPAYWRWVVPDETLAHLASARWIRANVPETQVALRVGSLLALADAVRQGMGVGWLLQPLAAIDRSLERLQEPVAAMDTDLWVLSHPSLRRVARVNVLMRFLAERLLADPLLARDGAADAQEHGDRRQAAAARRARR